MAGTDEEAVAAADDALHVLTTAALLTPAKFPSVLGDDSPEACAALGLPPLADGYGLVLGQDGEGAPADGPDGQRAGHSGIRRAPAEAHAYVSSPPPLGRIRSSFAPGDARTLRAGGPGWSLVARTDDMAFVLLDDEPGEVLPVGRGPELPGLLEGLDRIAVRPLRTAPGKGACLRMKCAPVSP
ncbi:hypothetical protein [Streptomyces sp. NPDC058625]|uniref:hypothetical protein n=1 Tax=Streptomyces sp. NPDC058625 TaxID=3346564 RepID=UPI0036534E87